MWSESVKTSEMDGRVTFQCQSEQSLRMVEKSQRRTEMLLTIGVLGQWYSIFFPPVPLETIFHSTLYPQSCWCLIQVIHN
jgi:hypothetical protein